MKKNMITFLLTAIMLCGCAQQGEAPSTSDNAPSSSEETEQPNLQELYADSPEFTGIAFDKDAAPCPSVNYKMFFPQMLCFNDETVYFANPRGGLRLYSFDGKETRRLTDIPAMSPFYRDGAVYFLSTPADYTQHSSDEKGKLYKYNVESGETVPLSDIAMSGLLADENGIYYSASEPEGNGISKIIKYKFDEESGSSEKISEVAWFQHYGDIELVFATPKEEGGGLVIYLKKGEEVYHLLTGVIPAQYSICDGKFYYFDQDTRDLFSIDLTNGERKELESAHDYSVLNGEFYYLSREELHKSGETELKLTYSDKFLSEHEDSEEIQDRDYHFNKLYTTRSELYALISWPSGWSASCIARITESDDGMLVEFLE